MRALPTRAALALLAILTGAPGCSRAEQHDAPAPAPTGANVSNQVSAEQLRKEQEELHRNLDLVKSHRNEAPPKK